MRRSEYELLAGVSGAAILSLVVFLLCAARVAYTGVFLVFGGLTTAVVLRRPAARRQGQHPIKGMLGLHPIKEMRGRSPAPAWALVPFVFYGVVYLANSLAPEFSPDGAAYHLGLVKTYFLQHGFERLTTNMYANLSQGMEMLFLFAFAFGRHSAAAALHCFFLLTLPVLIFLYANRIGKPWAGAGAGMLVYLSPLTGVDGVSAYNDVALATSGFAMFYLLEIWREERVDNLLIPIGLLAGFCFAIKYTGFVALVYATLVVRRFAVRLLLPAACVAVPWLLKNAIWLHNPVSPFLNRIFPNPYVHVSLEDFYRGYLAHYGLQSLKPLFWIVTVTGQLGGQIGPLFLLAPIALLALRFRAGRQCLLAAAVFLIPYPQNIGARFLIPALPFVAVAMALNFPRWAVPVVITAAAILAWPRVIDRYRAPSGGWQIVTVPWKAALGIIPRETWLRRYPGYRTAETINSVVPADASIWSDTSLAEAYLKPRVLVNYTSAEGEQIQDLLHMPVDPGMQPRWNLRFTFPARSLSHVRIAQDASSRDDIWSIGEVRFWNGAAEIRPVSAEAHPFSWDIHFALDGDPVTRWRSWKSIEPGMYVDFAFSPSVILDRVDLHCSHDQWKIRLRIEGVPARLEILEDPALPDLRQTAIRDVKAHGVRFLMTGSGDSAANDMALDPARWGLALAAHTEAGNLYEIR